MTRYRRRPGPEVVSAVQDHADAERWRAAEPLLRRIVRDALNDPSMECWWCGGLVGPGGHSPSDDCPIAPLLALLPEVGSR